MLEWLSSFLSLSDSTIRDAIAAWVWISVNGLGLITGWKWARRLFTQDSFLNLVGHTVIMFWAVVVGCGTALGAVGILCGPTFLFGVGLFSLAALWLLRYHSKEPPAPIPFDKAEVPWLLLWALLGGCFVGHVVIGGLFEFPSDWDSLAYHLPLVNHWLQSGSLWSTSCARWANPGNNEILVTWAVSPFSGDFFYSLNNLPAVAVFACKAVSVAMCLGLPRSLAHLAGFALVGNFVVFKQLIDVENDVAVAACFFAAVSSALSFMKKPKAATLVFGAISLGLLAGVKYYALGYTALSLAIWVILSHWRFGLRVSLRVLSVGIIGILVFGGFWYFRNIWVTGSPLYPRELFKNPDLLDRIYPEIAQTSFFGNDRPELLCLYIKAIWQLSGPCQLIGFVLAPFSFAWLLCSSWYFRSKSIELALSRCALAALLWGTGFLLGITPFAVEDSPGTLNQMEWQYCPVRYGLCFLSIATLAALVLLSDVFFANSMKEQAGAYLPHSSWSRSFRRFSAGVLLFSLAVAIITQFVWPDHRIPVEHLDIFLISLNFLLFGVVLVVCRSSWKRTSVWIGSLLLIVLPIGVWFCVFLSERWHDGFVPHYDSTLTEGGLQCLAQRFEGRQNTYALVMRYYPFFGSGRQHRVYQPVYVPSPEWLMTSVRFEGAAAVVADLEMASVQSVGARRFRGFEECRVQHMDSFHPLNDSLRFMICEIRVGESFPK